ncbi:MAG: VWA domain-containing protein, partial [Erysipelotrichaceae bacterium]|nr:VWA domain-containing protein [Erysipelotrichaceae bacterium]
PKKGRKHILFIIRELLNFQPVSNRTDIGVAVEYMTNAIKKRCTVFVMSDFFDYNDYRNQLTVANRRHDVVALQIYDIRMTELPDVGIVKMRDAETGQETFVDTSSQAVRRAHHEWWVGHQAWLQESFTKSNIDNVSVRTDEDYVKALMGLFKQRQA